MSVASTHDAQQSDVRVNERALLVEDDASLREVVSLVLTASGMQVEPVDNGDDAVRAFVEREHDLVILDVMLPGIDGFEVCRRLRERSAVPIVMLTARNEAGEVVRGLELGADDYVTKPFEAAVLLARVRAVLRRTGSEQEERLSASGIEIDPTGFRVWKHGEPLVLSSTEFRLLTELVRHRGQVLTREVLLQRVWNYDYLGDSRLVDMAIKRVRDKVEDDPGRPVLVTTVRGVGYRFERDA